MHEVLCGEGRTGDASIEGVLTDNALGGPSRGRINIGKRPRTEPLDPPTFGDPMGERKDQVSWHPVSWQPRGHDVSGGRE